MANAHTRLAAADTFTGSPATGQKLATSANWQDVQVGTNACYWGADEDANGTSDCIEFRDSDWAGVRVVNKYVAAAPHSPNYTVWAEYGGEGGTSTRTTTIAVAARIRDSGANWDGYVLRYALFDDGTKTLALQRFINDGLTTLASANAVLVAGDTIALEVIGSGSTVSLKGYLNGSELLTASDNSADRITDAGSPGVYGWASSSGLNHWRQRFREWRLYEAGRQAAMCGPLAGRQQVGFALAR